LWEFGVANLCDCAFALAQYLAAIDPLLVDLESLCFSVFEANSTLLLLEITTESFGEEVGGRGEEFTMRNETFLFFTNEDRCYSIA
jgi:hypothetical protein